MKLMCISRQCRFALSPRHFVIRPVTIVLWPFIYTYADVVAVEAFVDGRRRVVYIDPFALYYTQIELGYNWHWLCVHETVSVVIDNSTSDQLRAAGSQQQLSHAAIRISRQEERGPPRCRWESFGCHLVTMPDDYNFIGWFDMRRIDCWCRFQTDNQRPSTGRCKVGNYQKTTTTDQQQHVVKDKQGEHFQQEKWAGPTDATGSTCHSQPESSADDSLSE